MKYFLLVVLLVSANTMVFAQGKEQVKLTERLEEFRKALLKRDARELEKLLSDKLSYGHSSGEVDDKATFINKATSKDIYNQIDVTDQTMSLSGDVGIVRMGTTIVFTNESGKSNQLSLLVLMVWRKEKGNWMLLARQATRKPEPK